MLNRNDIDELRMKADRCAYTEEPLTVRPGVLWALLDSYEKNEATEEKIGKLEEENEKLRDELECVQFERDNLDDELRAANKAVEQLEDEVATLKYEKTGTL